MPVSLVAQRFQGKKGVVHEIFRPRFRVPLEPDFYQLLEEIASSSWYTFAPGAPIFVYQGLAGTRNEQAKNFRVPMTLKPVIYRNFSWYTKISGSVTAFFENTETVVPQRFPDFPPHREKQPPVHVPVHQKYFRVPPIS